MKSFVTLLSSENYLDGVITLNASLKKVGSRFPLNCLLSSGVDKSLETKLNEYDIPYIRLDSPAISVSSNNVQKFANWDYTFDKLTIWGLTQFERIVFVDCDMLIVKNIDHLFELPDFSASLAGVKYPSCEGLSGLNSGLMVLTPNKHIEHELLSLAELLVPQFRKEGKPIGDQDVIHTYLPNWFDHKELILDDGYNLYSRYLQCYIRHHSYSIKGNGVPIYIIHYVGIQKPWMVDNVWKFAKMVIEWFPNIYHIWAVLLYRKAMRSAYKSKSHHKQFTADSKVSLR